ncbi:MAG: leucine-rich repeat domain-containing protein [Defluviitaleaceae bacterium]|nr:leucine-rich repeat domain-containing protein [Defluviitaleaceae bacterium]
MKKFYIIALVAVILAVSVVPIANLTTTRDVFANTPPHVTAQAAILMDFDTGEILFQRDIHAMRVPASMTKAVTAFVVFEEIAAGNLTMETPITISANAARISADANMQGAPFPLASGSSHSVRTLLQLLLMPSSNGAAVAFAEHISGSESAFANRMNESGRAIGMTTDFNNAHGALPHQTTAYSMAILVREFITRYPEILEITGAATMQFQGRTVNNTNQLLSGSNFYAGADGFRTGTTREAGFCLAATATRDGRRLITVVMNAPNDAGRYGDTRRLLDFGFAQLASRVTVTIDGVPVQFEGQQPIIVNDRTLVPVRVLERLGYNVFWEAGLGQNGGVSIRSEQGWPMALLSIGSNEIFVEWEDISGELVSETNTMDVPAQIMGGSTMLPIAALLDPLSRAAVITGRHNNDGSPLLGRTVTWDGTTRTVAITNNWGVPTTPATPAEPAADFETPSTETPWWENGENDENEVTETAAAPEFITIAGVQVSTAETGLTIHVINNLESMHPWIRIEESLLAEELGQLRYMTNLVQFSAQASIDGAVDITVFENLVNLRALTLVGGQISSIAPVANLTNLEWLRIHNNQIVDITPLAGLVNLTELELSHNQIVDITPLAGLTNLIDLNLSSNQIVDISPLAGLDNSWRFVHLDNNQITDISALAGLNINWINLEGNEITDWSPVDHIEIVAGRPADWQRN